MNSKTSAAAKKWAVANWKQFGRQNFVREWCANFTPPPSPSAGGCQAVICPPFSYLSLLRAQLPASDIAIGAQNVASNGDDGAHTGEVSASMLADCGCEYVIIGHSERRQSQGESDDDCRAKLAAAAEAELTPILCVGESLATRQAGSAVEFVTQQLTAALKDHSRTAPLLVAYEPIWAIGSGQAAKSDDIATMHAAIHAQLSDKFDRIGLLYGGSVNPSNIGSLSCIDFVDGVLIGGASLDPTKMNHIITTLSS